MADRERQENISEFLKSEGRSSVKKIAEALYVSEATIRRELKEMEAVGLIERAHGSAAIATNVEEIAMFVRIGKNAKEKERAATKALLSLPDFKTVFLDGSSTVLALAERMDLSHKTVMTHNFETAVMLSKKQDINLFFLGGHVQSNSVSVAGSWAIRAVSDFKFDLMLCSCAGIDETDAYERSIEQRELKLAVFKQSKKRILIIDSSKYGLGGHYKFVPLESFDAVICDKKPPETWADSPVNFLY